MSRIVPAPIIGESAASGAQVIDGSLKFNDDSSQYLNRAPSSAGNKTVWTFSFWIKLNKVDGQRQIFSVYNNSSNDSLIKINSNGYLEIWNYRSGAYKTQYISNAQFRDTSSWYNFIISCNGSTSLNVWVNGVAITFSTSTGPDGTDWLFNDTNSHQIGRYNTTANSDFQLTQVNWIDGQALGPENFGFTDPLTNTWRPRKYTGDFNIGTSDYSGTFAPYSTSARFNSFKTYTNVNENATSYTLPMGNPSHYGGKALDLASGGFQVQTNNSAAGDFFMAIWVNLDAYETSKQFGVDIAGNYVYFETVSSGAVKIRHNGSGGNTSNSGYANDTNQWQHWALSRSGGSLRAFVDGEQIVTDTGGISGDNTVLANSKFNFFGADNNTTSYNINGQVIDAVIYIGQGVSGNFTPPTAPLIDSSGNINHYSGFSDSQLYFASPLVDVSGSDPNTISDYYTTGTNSFYLPFDGNSPIGEDKSGNGNNWTPVIFGGSAGIDQATGALPILNTTQGGTQATVGVRTDAYASNLVVAMPLVGITEDVSNRINSGTTAKTVSQTGSSSDIAASTEKSNFYASSAKFNGNVARLEISGGGGTDGDYDFGTGDFTMECWFYPTATVNTNNRLFCSRGDRNNYQLMIGSNKYLQFDISGTSYTSANNVFGLNKWHHFAVTRQSGTLRLFVNGVIVKEQASVTADLDETTGIDIGYESGYSSYINGYMQDARVYKGVAKYTSDFVPASTNPDILPETPSGVSGSSKLTKITDGAVSFDGSDDDLQLADSADWDYGTNPFTIEFYVYPNVLSGVRPFISVRQAGNGGWGAYWYNNLVYFIAAPSEALSYTTSAGALAIKKWTHIAFVRDGNTFTTYIDGVSKGTTTSSLAVDNIGDDVLTIGRVWPSGMTAFDGLISNVRIVKGTALYTSNFTPPSAPLTNVTNTKLLCCQSNTQAGSAAVAPTIGGVNNGTNWSHFLTTNAGDNFDGSGPKYYAFDGNGSNKAYTGNNSDGTTQGSSFLQVNFPSPISGALRVKCDNGNTVRNVTSGDTLLATQSSGSDNQFVDCGNVSNLRKLRVLMSGGSRPAISVVELDGTTLVDPASPVGNTAATNFNPFSTDINTARGQETGYPTWNPLRVSGQTLSNNNMTTTGASGNVLGSMFTPTSGKFYWEVTAGSDYTMTGIQRENNYDMSYPGNSAGQIAMYLNTGVGSGQLYKAGGVTSSWGGGVTGDVIGVALDMDNNKVYFYNNGRGLGAGGFTGTPEAVDVPTGGGYTANCRSGSGAYDGPSTINFGQNPFKFPPPEGFQPLTSTTLRPDTVIARPDPYVGATLYTGNAGTKSIDVGHKPDFVWVKARTGSARSHFLFDSVRGVQKFLQTDGTAGEANADATSLTSFNNDGFTTGSRTGMNDSSVDYVAWTWKAGGGDKPISDLVFGVDTDDNGFDSSSTSRTFDATGFTFGSYTTPQSHPGGTYGANSAQVYKSSSGKTVKWTVSTSTADKYIWTSSDGQNWSSSGSQYDTDSASQSVTSKWIALSGGANAASLTVTGTHAFNVDDVAYANASNVNMSVGDLNSSFYNTSETWSNGLSALSGSSLTNPPNGFNGDPDSYADSTNGWSLDLSGHTFGTGAHTIEVKSGGATSFSVGGTTESGSLTDPGGGGAKVWTGTYTGEINSITSSASGASVYYVKIDGKILVNSGTDLSTLTQYPSIPVTGCSVGTKQGFSIISYTGTGSAGTLSHGLSQAPDLIIMKGRNFADNWRVYHKHLDSIEPEDYYLMLESTNGKSADQNASFMNDTAPTNSVFSLGTDSAINGSTRTMIAYCWHDVPGLQKFGTFTANNSTDGPYVELGFRPSIVWVKAASTAGDMTYASWLITDGERSPTNVVSNGLFANKSAVEGKRGNGSDNYTGAWLDILSNGFKIRYTGTEVNGVSGQTYIYCAWAEAPAFNLHGAQSNAR